MLPRLVAVALADGQPWMGALRGDPAPEDDRILLVSLSDQR